jgi:hypothetical protein
VVCALRRLCRAFVFTFTMWLVDWLSPQEACDGHVVLVHTTSTCSQGPEQLRQASMKRAEHSMCQLPRHSRLLPLFNLNPPPPHTHTHTRAYPPSSSTITTSPAPSAMQPSWLFYACAYGPDNTSRATHPLLRPKGVVDGDNIILQQDSKAKHRNSDAETGSGVDAHGDIRAAGLTPPRSDEDIEELDGETALKHISARRLRFDASVKAGITSTGNTNSSSIGGSGGRPSSVATRAVSPSTESIDGSSYTAVLGGVLSCDSLGVGSKRHAARKGSAPSTQSKMQSSRGTLPQDGVQSRPARAANGGSRAANSASHVTTNQKTGRNTPPKVSNSTKVCGKESYSYTNSVFGCEGAPFGPDDAAVFGCEGAPFAPEARGGHQADGVEDDGVDVDFALASLRFAEDGDANNVDHGPSRHFAMLERCAAIRGAPRPLHEGFLTKQGTFVRNWKRRYEQLCPRRTAWLN